MAHGLSRREIIKPARTLKKVQVSKETNVESSAHEQQPNSEPIESHTYSISLRYIFTYKIFSRGFQVVAFVEICQAKSCTSVHICHVPDVAPLHSSSFIYLQFRFRVQIMDFIVYSILMFVFQSQNILVNFFVWRRCQFMFFPPGIKFHIHTYKSNTCRN